ncbi:XdhC family protein [Brucella endophytica]
MANGRRCALATLVEIIDGASRTLGAHMAVCEGADRVCRFGKGSPYFDIAVPCGGGIGLTIHVLKNADIIDVLLGALARREAIGLVYDPGRGHLAPCDGLTLAGWRGGSFVTRYRPEPRIFLSGQGIEGRTFAAIAASAGAGCRRGGAGWHFHRGGCGNCHRPPSP